MITSPQPPQTAFTVMLTTPAGDEQLLSLWSLSSGPGDVSFAAGEAVPQEPIWRARLPADTREAWAALAAARTRLSGELDALHLAAARYVRFNERLRSPGPQDFSSPEAEMMSELRDAGMLESVSFDVISGTAEETGARALAWFRDTWSRLRSLVAERTWVETTLGGVLVARTALGRSGDVMTAWRELPAQPDIDLHNQTVELALRSKMAILRTLTFVIRGATMVAALVASPVSAAMAIPAIWKYVNEIGKQPATVS